MSVTGNIGRGALQVRITPHTVADDYGKQQHTAEWINHNGTSRGQVFRCRIEDTAAGFRRNGYAVQIEEMAP